MRGIKSSVLIRLTGGSGELAEPLEYYNWQPSKITTFVGSVIVPLGFITDFASIPRYLTPLIAHLGAYNNAAILHDYLYSPKKPHALSRYQCDRIFLHAMHILEVPRWKRNLIYYAVRTFGKTRFRTTE